MILEAAYVGLYCIANNIPGTRSIINNLGCGNVVNNNDIDTYIKLIKNLDKNIKGFDIEKVREEINEKYSTNAIAIKFSKIYDELC